MSSFERYVTSLIGSWRALAAPHPDARVLVEPGWVAFVSPSFPVFSNALLLDASALPAVCATYADRSVAIWSHQPDAAAALDRAGWVRDEVTWPMVCQLGDLGSVASAPVGVERVDPAVVTDLNDLPATLLQGVPGVRAYASNDQASGAVLIEVGEDVNVSFVATRPLARGRGMASAVVAAALADARRDGFVTSSLQATAAARGLYARLGYVEVGRWQEWVTPTSGPAD